MFNLVSCDAARSALTSYAATRPLIPNFDLVYQRPNITWHRTPSSGLNSFPKARASPKATAQYYAPTHETTPSRSNALISPRPSWSYHDDTCCTPNALLIHPFETYGKPLANLSGSPCNCPRLNSISIVHRNNTRTLHA